MEPLLAKNIEAFITNNLVLFRSTRELQDQNQKLLKIVRSWEQRWNRRSKIIGLLWRKNKVKQ
jgi:hypothetical protein